MILNRYDEKLAGVYDQMYPIQPDTDAAVDFLVDLCPPEGTVLELGVGTGRVAIPLSRRGLKVFGIDASEAMLDELRRRDPDGAVVAELGDYMEVGTGRQHDLITMLLNTFYTAVTKEQQVGVLKLVREQLTPGGRFVVEAFDPADFHAMRDPHTSVRLLGDESVMLDNLVVDRSQQIMLGSHTILDGGRPHTTRHVVRYVFPAELDLLGELAGLRRVDRFGHWDRSPYHAGSSRYISVFVRDDN
ncbi:class I SAM-dependent methyltransferase [Micromonospora sp. NPDC023888]|uniref:class I SAM-dependent methyltransferase n=1 Tax=Micromonospora sp. NPDC023888 TaxID=3155607 RepID=UPI00340A42D5